MELVLIVICVGPCPICVRSGTDSWSCHPDSQHWNILWKDPFLTSNTLSRLAKCFRVMFDEKCVDLPVIVCSLSWNFKRMHILSNLYRWNSNHWIALGEKTIFCSGTRGSRWSACGPKENLKERRSYCRLFFFAPLGTWLLLCLFALSSPS